MLNTSSVHATDLLSWHRLPPIQQTIKRSRLLHVINKPFQAKLTTVTAPSGYGKTTLIAQWAHDVNFDVCWASADASPLTASALALQMDTWLTVQYGPDTSAPEQSSALVSNPSPLTAVGKRIAQLQAPITLVLDDVHEMPQEELGTILNALLILPGTPDNLRIVLISRNRQHRTLTAPLAAYGHLREVSSTDLIFTPEEAAEVVHALEPSQASESRLNDVITQSEGWIAGILLMLHSTVESAHQSDAETCSPMDEYVMHFVLGSLPMPLLPTLLASASLPYLDAPLWQSLHQSEPASHSLEEVLQLYPFLVQVEPGVPRYRHHRLIRSCLQRLTELLVPINRLHAYLSHAQTHLQSIGKHAEALNIALQVSDWNCAFELAFPIAHSLALRDQHAELLHLVQPFPQEVLIQNDNLAFWVLIAHLSSGHIEQGEALFKRVEAGWNDPDRPLHQGRYFICLTLLQIFDGQRDEALSNARRSLAILPADASHERFRAAASSSVLAAHIGRADLSQSMFELTRTYREQLPWDQEWWNVFVLPNQADHLALAGKLPDATALYTHQLVTFPESFRNRASLINLRLALIALEQDDRETARALINAIDDHDQASYWLLEVNLVRAQLAWVDKDWQTAEELVVETINQASRRQSRVEMHRGETLLAQMWVDRGNLALARAWADTTSFATDRWPRTFGHLVPEAVLAQLLIAEGKPEHALRTTASLIALGESRQQPGPLVRVRAIEALAHTRLGNSDAAYQALQRTRAVGTAGGFARSYLVGAVDTRTLGTTPAANDDIPEQALLSNREAEVLSLLGRGLRNREIADQLSISEYTVKSHLARIYPKLGVQNRTGAMKVGRDLGLT